MRGVKAVIDVVFPRRCPVCQRAVKPGTFICQSCEGKLKYIEEPFCLCCGKPVTTGQEYCLDCSHKSHEFQRGRAVFLYNKPMKKAIYRFKYENRREYGDFFAMEMVKALSSFARQIQVDAIVPIPLHSKREQHRGYNQSALIANILGKEWKIPVYENLLIRAANTKPQKNLTNEQRKNNLRNAFLMKENGLQLEKVLLIDDIYTTGSTMDAAASVLKEGGIQEVYFVSISLGRGF